MIRIALQSASRPSLFANNMASSEPTRVAPAEVGNSASDRESRPDERTPLLGLGSREEATNGAVAGGVFSQNIRRWRRQRWASTLCAFVLVATIVTLTLLFGGPQSLLASWYRVFLHCRLIRCPSSLQQGQDARVQRTLSHAGMRPYGIRAAIQPVAGP